MSEHLREIEAQLLWRQGLIEQHEGRLSAALDLYRRSLELHPTAEAYTYQGWALSLQDQGEHLDEAIEACRHAIEVDPDFGNPYNDIGCYLMQKGEFGEAVPWLERAKSAVRYEARQFPFINLGRLYLRQARWKDARREFEQAVLVAPNDLSARRALRSLIARFN
jgi:Tfp pilus assembly protein PilF